MTAAAAMGLPMLFTEMRGHFGIGLVMALGALSATRNPPLATLSERRAAALGAFLPSALAALTAALLSEIGAQADLAMVGLVSLCALLMRYSRPVAISTVRFILFLVIFSTAISASRTPWRLAGLVAVGAFWTAVLVFVMSLIMTRSPQPSTKPPESSARKRVTRMRRELALPGTWDYPLRLLVGLGLSLLIRQIYPSHHYSWITVAVALLTPRHFEMWPIKATQRFIGTIIGVLAAGLLLTEAHTSLVLMIATTLLAGLRSWYEERSYLLYTAVMAPLILCLMGSGHATPDRLLVDRIVATLFGVLLVWFSNWVASVTTARAAIRGDPSSAPDRAAVS